MSGLPYQIHDIVLAANIPRTLRVSTRFLSLVSATVNLATVEIALGESDSFQPLIFGLALVELDKVTRLTIRSTDSQTVRVATGSAMVYDSRAAPSGGTVSMSIIDVGGNGLGQEPMAASVPVVIASNQSAVPVAGETADGAAVAGKVPVLVAGQDGTNVQTLKTDTNGRAEVTGPVAAGAAISTHAPVLVGGSDGTNVQRLRVDTTGRPVVVGPVQHDSAVSTDAPIMLSAEARSTERAAVASADVARLVTDLVGKLITMPYANPENIVSGKTAAMTGTADTAVVAAAGVGVRNYITTIVVVNDHATVGTEVVIKDGATEVFRVYVPALNGTAGPNTVTITLPVPIRGTANTALNAANVTTGSNTYVAAFGYKGV
jgi:hypothetical protein